ncbi:MAG: hypothetical protein HY875_07510 [Chloroflexi bacterium]|nr:hypothetical protein [Chloroflexota bacterium]
MSGERRPSFAASRANWKGYDAPFATKLKMLLRNNWTKMRTRGNCCGNDGEPGC